MMRLIFLARAFDGRWISIDISVLEYATVRPSKFSASHNREIAYGPVAPAAQPPHVRSRDNSSHYRTPPRNRGVAIGPVSIGMTDYLNVRRRSAWSRFNVTIF